MCFHLSDIADDESANWSPVEVNKLIELWPQHIADINRSPSQRTLTMFAGVVAHCVVLITECHNSHKHSQSPLTR